MSAARRAVDSVNSITCTAAKTVVATTLVVASLAVVAYFTTLLLAYPRNGEAIKSWSVAVHQWSDLFLPSVLLLTLSNIAMADIVAKAQNY